MALKLKDKEARIRTPGDGAGTGRRVGKVDSILTFTCLALTTGGTAYLASHLLAAQLRGAVGGVLTASSGLVWAASAMGTPKTPLTSGLGVAAAWLAYLAGLCVLP